MGRLKGRRRRAWPARWPTFGASSRGPARCSRTPSVTVRHPGNRRPHHGLASPNHWTIGRARYVREGREWIAARDAPCRHASRLVDFGPGGNEIRLLDASDNDPFFPWSCRFPISRPDPAVSSWRPSSRAGHGGCLQRRLDWPALRSWTPSCGPPHGPLVLDLCSCGFIDSSGLFVIVRHQVRPDGFAIACLVDGAPAQLFEPLGHEPERHRESGAARCVSLARCRSHSFSAARPRSG